MTTARSVPHPITRPRLNLGRLSIGILFACLFIALLSITEADVDLWGHLRYGLDNLEQGTILQTDPYSYLTGGQRWINHEWLAEVLFGLAWRMGGATGLVGLKMLVGLLTLAILWRHFTEQRTAGLAAGGLLLLGFILQFSDLITVRPAIFTLLLFTSLLYLLIQADAGRERLLWAAVPLFALWSNLHGGFLAGVGVMGLWSVLRVIQRRSFKPALPFVACLAATLLTPYGPALLIFLLRTATVPRPEIWEWMPQPLTQPLGLAYLLLLGLSIAGLVWSRRPRSLALILLFGLMAVMPLVARRHLSLAASAALLLAGQHVVDTWSRATLRTRLRVRPLPGWLAVLPLLASLVLLAWRLPNAGQIPVKPLPPYPITAVNLLKDSGVAGNLAVEFSWGEYVIWHLGPQVQVAVDGRRETVYSPKVYAQNLNFLFGLENWDAILTEYPTDMALVGQPSPVYNLLRLQPGWSLVFEDQFTALFVRSGSAVEEPLRQAAGRLGAPASERPVTFFP